jgi:tellurite resistance protein TerC
MMLGTDLKHWIVFHAVFFGLLLFDLLVVNRKSHVIAPKQAALWTLFWVGCGLLFGVYIGSQLGWDKASLYFTGYVVEESLSIDNLFVFIVIFSSFKVPPSHQHRLLFWGIMGAIIMRGLLIVLGVSLLAKFEWLIFIFGLFLVWTAVKIYKGGTEELDPTHTPAYRFAKRFLPLSSRHETAHFFVREAGKLKMTMGFVVLLVIESSDLLFALDSVPAVLGITRDPYIVYTSNLFAILGLRSLYFLLQNAMNRFHLLKYGLSIVLAYVGGKMLVEAGSQYASGHPLHMPPLMNLGIILLVLLVSIVLSLKTSRHKRI